MNRETTNRIRFVIEDVLPPILRDSALFRQAASLVWGKHITKLAKFRDTEELTFPLLSDPERAVLGAWGAYGEKKMYGKTVQGVIRSTFVVDEKGNIAVAQYNVKATGHVAKLRRDLSV